MKLFQERYGLTEYLHRRESRRWQWFAAGMVIAGAVVWAILENLS